MGKVFISYAHEDEEKARKIKARLDDLGFETWIDRSAPASRDDISTVIDNKLSSVDCVLVLWSADSRGSVWVRGEALKGLESNKYLGLLLTAFVPPVPFNALAAPDLSDWTGLHLHFGWDALVRGLADMSASKAAILRKHAAYQKEENDEADRLANKQERLPLEEPAEPLDVGPAQSDVEAIIAATKAILGRSAKLDLTASIAQAALDQEMLRDATFVVSASDNVPRPIHARFEIERSIGAALKRANDGDLIVVDRGRFEECLRITKRVRIVGLGAGADRPVIAARTNQATIAFSESARLENIAVETRYPTHAVQCDRGQPAILRCDIRRFADASDDNDAAFYVAGKANPIVIATSIASTGCRALYFVVNSGGQFLGVNVVALRGDGMTCRGRPEFHACTIEAIGAHAVSVFTSGAPTFEGCDISGRGAAVIKAGNRAYPRITESRVNAIRQLAFDFEDDASGRYEGNIVSIETDENAGTGRKSEGGFFARFKSKQDGIVRKAQGREFARLKGRGKPLFIANVTPTGEELLDPVSFGGF
jgi:hypothetical protein